MKREKEAENLQIHSDNECSTSSFCSLYMMLLSQVSSVSLYYSRSAIDAPSNREEFLTRHKAPPRILQRQKGIWHEKSEVSKPFGKTTGAATEFGPFLTFSFWW